MIRHIVFFNVKDSADYDQALAGLSLLKQNPHALRLEVQPNLRRDQLSGEIDLVVYGEFTDTEALAAYKAHPSYQHAIDLVRPIRDMRIAADIEAG
ncbi:MAG: stress responsive protein [Rhodobacterales bacterium]|nr:MAG: stress responsive protein [Rhodobacterales bacterium]